MKVNELVMNIKHPNFDMSKELQVKTYLPIEVKKAIAQGIIYECTEEVNGFIKLDSMQQYMSYVRYMIKYHTNLEYTDYDYDTLCQNEYKEMTLLNAILNCFGDDAKECSRILNLMLDDYMEDNSIESNVAKLVYKLYNLSNDTINSVVNKLEDIDLKSLIPENFDVEKLNNFLQSMEK